MRENTEYQRWNTWIGYDVDKLVTALEHGHEITFTHKNHEYGILRSREGWYLSMIRPEQKQLAGPFPDVRDLIRVMRIDGKSFGDLVTNHELYKKIRVTADLYPGNDTWTGYDFVKLVTDPEQGREFEITYNNREYGIFFSPWGWSFSRMYPEFERLTGFYRDIHDLIAVIRIEGKTLGDLVKNHELDKKIRVLVDPYYDRDNWTGYDYEKMVTDLEHGREIEFTCNNKEFGIFTATDGWEFGMAKPEKKMFIKNCPDIYELISTIRIDGKTLEELWRDHDLTEKDIIHVF